MRAVESCGLRKAKHGVWGSSCLGRKGSPGRRWEGRRAWREGRQCPHPERSEEGGEGRLGSLRAQELEGVANESGLDNSLVTRSRGLAEKGGRVVKGVWWGVCTFVPGRGFLSCPRPCQVPCNIISFIYLC